MDAVKPDDYYRVQWRCKRPGGGLTLINLIHDIDSLRFVCGEIRQVYVQVEFRRYAGWKWKIP